MNWTIISEEWIEQSAWKEATIEKAKTLLRLEMVSIETLRTLPDGAMEVKGIVNGQAKEKPVLLVSSEPSFQCTCAAARLYDGACKHIIALAYLYNDKARVANGKSLSPKQVETYDEATYLLQQLADVWDADSGYRGREKVAITYVFALQATDDPFASSFRLRIGTRKNYVVKDIREAVDALLYERVLLSGKRTLFDPADQYVATKDREMLRFLSEQFVSKPAGFRSFSMRSVTKSEWVITANQVKAVLTELIKMDSVQIVWNHQDQEPIAPGQILLKDGKSGPFPIHLHLANHPKQEEEAVLSLIEEQAAPIQLLPHLQLLLAGNKLYLLSGEELRIVDILLTTLQKGNQSAILLPKTMLRDYMTTVLPVLEKRVEVTVSEEIEKLFEKTPLEATLTLDYREHSLFLNVCFQYGSHLENPLLPHANESSLPDSMLVDTEKENTILSLLYQEELPYEQGPNGYILHNEADMVRFLLDTVPKLEPLVTVERTEAMKRFFFDVPDDTFLSVRMNRSRNLLDVSFDVPDLSEKEWKQVMRAISNQKTFRKLSNGQYINLRDPILQQMSDALHHFGLETPVRESSSVPLFRILGLNKNTSSSVHIDEEVKAFVHSIIHHDEQAYALPKLLQADLRLYQQKGYNWLRTMDSFGFGGILADDMGLGKTVQALAFIGSLLESTEQPILVVCPSSVLYNWENECHRFLPGVEPLLITGSKQERLKAIESISTNQAKLVLTTYPSLLRDQEWYHDVAFRTILLDEAQVVKNQAAKTTSVVRHLKAQTKFALSGTPIENNLNEMYSLVSIVLPGLFSSKQGFQKLSKQEIATKLGPFILRRMKSEVLKELPDKTESIAAIELAPSQKAVYVSQVRKIRKQAEASIQNDSFSKERIQFLAGLTRLRQLCCDPSLVLEDYEGESSKLDYLLEYLETAFLNNKRIVLFSQFTSMLAIIKKRLDELGQDYFYLDGQTAKKERVDLANRFNEGEKSLFLVSLKAGGTGLNLTGGDTVILYDSWWNPAVENQAMDRVHRYGQKKAVQVLRFVCKGTIEERMLALQESKRELVDEVLAGSNQSLTSLTQEELLHLLR